MAKKKPKEEPENQELKVEDFGVKLSQEEEEYFQNLEKQGIYLTAGQQAWYIKKQETQGEHMKREYPSTPEESFESSNDGYYFAKYLNKARQEKRVCHLPPDDYARIFSAWDIGWNDETSIWVFQVVGREIHFIDYYENSEEALVHYVNWFRNRPYKVEKHFLPHDSRAKSVSTGKSFADFARQAGLKVDVLERLIHELEGIELTRSMFSRFFFDERHCLTGIKALDNFRKEWNEKLSCYRDKSLHDWASHGAKSLIYACQAVSKMTGGAGLSAEEWRRIRNQFV